MPSKKREQELLDRMWNRVRPLLPPRPPQPRGGHPFADDKACLAGIVYQLRNAIRWDDMPARVPSGATCRRRPRDGTAAGRWPKVRKPVLAELAAAGLLNTTALFRDATFAESRNGGHALAGRGAAAAGVSNG